MSNNRQRAPRRAGAVQPRRGMLVSTAFRRGRKGVFGDEGGGRAEKGVFGDEGGGGENTGCDSRGEGDLRCIGDLERIIDDLRRS